MSDSYYVEKHYINFIVSISFFFDVIFLVDIFYTPKVLRHSETCIFKFFPSVFLTLTHYQGCSSVNNRKTLARLSECIISNWKQGVEKLNVDRLELIAHIASRIRYTKYLRSSLVQL